MQLLETIRFHKGEFSNLSYHQSRMNNSRRELFKCIDEIDLFSILKNSTSGISRKKLYKCRVIYDSEIHKIEFIPYTFPDIRSLKIITSNDIEYNHKYFDRDRISQLMKLKGNADDIIIVKNGLITDSSIANLIFYNGERWLTPAFPLLKGTQRDFLLEHEKIQTADIRPIDLHNFSKIRLINAMIRLEDEADIFIEDE